MTQIEQLSKVNNAVRFFTDRARYYADRKNSNGTAIAKAAGKRLLIKKEKLLAVLN